jgi:hypothetical protein
MLRVVHVSDNLMSGAPYRLAQIQRQYGLDARVINRDAQTTTGRVPRAFPHDLLCDQPRQLLEPVLETANLIHYHHRWKQSHLFEAHPWAWELVKDRPSLMQFHVPRAPHAEAVLRDPRVIKLVVAQYQVRMYPECIPVQNAIPIDDEWHRPLFVRNEPPIIAFTPPDCQADGWWDKGCAPTKEILGRGGFRHRIVTDAAWSEAMRVRQHCDVGIDEVVSGSYHVCSLESLSQGLATVANLDDRTVDALEQVTGTRRHPWVVASLATLHQRLVELCSDPAYLQERREQSRAYVVRYWHPRLLVEKIRPIYEQVLERHS